MKTRTFALPVIAVLALAGPLSNQAGAAGDRQSQITIPGTVVSSGGGKLMIRTDDHGHRMPFDVGSSVALPEGLRKGAHVSVTYHPLGPTGQAADEVLVIDRNADARSQSSFKVVTGPTDIKVSAR
jgi:hypothetical protein